MNKIGFGFCWGWWWWCYDDDNGDESRNSGGGGMMVVIFKGLGWGFEKLKCVKLGIE